MVMIIIPIIISSGVVTQVVALVFAVLHFSRNNTTMKEESRSGVSENLVGSLFRFSFPSA